MAHGECQGPCLWWCSRAQGARTTALLAYAALTYVLASALYMLVTRCMGTPFLDSLTPEQKAIKKASSRDRMRVFVSAAVLSAATLWAAAPLRGVEGKK